jgi:ADP-dependent NAD(P)H-hydrate dehydratase
MNLLERMHRLAQPVVISPHAGEMARLQGRDKADVDGDGMAALHGASQWNVVVALKGAVTSIASPEGRLWRHEAGQPGLATSGSGDVLAGLIAGLAARGAALEQAAAWGVVLHALAGGRLARRLGPLGYLARELGGEVPSLMNRPWRRARPHQARREPRG